MMSVRMEAEQLLDFEPQELSFSIEPKKQLFSSLRLFNKTNNHVVFKLLTTNPKNYGVRPRIGILSPGSAREITVTMRAMREAPLNMRCKDKFMIQSAVASPDATTEAARNMFNTEAGHVFHECKLRVVYIFPTEVPSLSPTPEVPSLSPTPEVPSLSPPPEVPSPVVDKIMESSSGESAIENANPNDCGIMQVITSDKEPEEDVVQINTRKLLDIQPRELRFTLKSKEHKCSIQLSNLTENHVAFMVKTGSSKYSVHPNVGIILPRSTCEIEVRTQTQSKVQSEMQCEDNFLIHSFVAIPAATVENITPEMFNKGGASVEECDLQVIHILKQEETFSNRHAELVKWVIVCLLGLVFWYLMKQTLSLIWSLTMVIIMLMMKMIKKLVSESVEDWVVKTLFHIFKHLLFKRTANVHLS